MMPKTRVEAFTDAVIAIILTLLILELKIPEKADWSALTQSGHKIIIYLISFVTLLIYWNNHHHLFQSVRKIDGRVLWMNNLLILTLTFFPFVTGWVGEHPFSWPPQALYGLVVLGADGCLLSSGAGIDSGKWAQIRSTTFVWPLSKINAFDCVEYYCVDCG